MLKFIFFFSLNCYCSDDVPNDDQKVIDADCDTICVGNSNETCGGDDRIQIYNLKSKYNIAYDFIRLINC